MNNYPKLNFPAIRLRAQRVRDDIYVWDALRQKFLLLTPEEWVRRHAIEHLVSSCNVEPHSIVQEYQVSLNGMAQRADIVVIGRDCQPSILVECKAPEVKIDKVVLDQAMRYNAVVKARYVVLTNGLKHYCYERTDDDYRPMAEFPKM